METQYKSEYKKKFQNICHKIVKVNHKQGRRGEKEKRHNNIQYIEHLYIYQYRPNSPWSEQKI